jgi:hypothetical protein
LLVQVQDRRQPKFEETPMSITFQKRQKEMKRIEKQKEKAQRRAEKKLAKKDSDTTNGTPIDPALDPTIDWSFQSDLDLDRP